MTADWGRNHSCGHKIFVCNASAKTIYMTKYDTALITDQRVDASKVPQDGIIV